jgi:hypothetical protein
MDRSIGLGLDIYMLVCTLVVLDRHWLLSGRLFLLVWLHR